MSRPYGYAPLQIALHVVGAVDHHVVLQDGLIIRMSLSEG